MYIKTFVHTTKLVIFVKKPMTKKSDIVQEFCLYFSTNSLSRHINELAESAFNVTGLAPSYAYLMMILIEEPGLNQSEVSKKMNLKASTMTRFIEKLKLKGLVETSKKGRTVYLYPTEKGKELSPLIKEALKKLHQNYCEILGKDFATKLTANIHKANILLEK